MTSFITFLPLLRHQLCSVVCSALNCPIHIAVHSSGVVETIFTTNGYDSTISKLP